MYKIKEHSWIDIYREALWFEIYKQILCKPQKVWNNYFPQQIKDVHFITLQSIHFPLDQREIKWHLLSQNQFYEREPTQLQNSYFL